MKEADIQREIVHTLTTRYNALAISTIDYQPMNKYGRVITGNGDNPGRYPRDGFPDVSYWAGEAGWIEVKYDKTSFSFADWRENQRNWYYQWGHTGHYWLGIGLGHKKPNSKDPLRRRLFIVPAEVVLATEAQMATQSLKSIPVTAEATTRIVCRDPTQHPEGLGLNASTLWSEWALNWEQGGWSIPEAHPLFPYAGGSAHGDKTNDYFSTGSVWHKSRLIAVQFIQGA